MNLVDRAFLIVRGTPKKLDCLPWKFTMENPIPMEDFEVPPFQETSINIAWVVPRGHPPTPNGSALVDIATARRVDNVSLGQSAREPCGGSQEESG